MGINIRRMYGHETSAAALQEKFSALPQEQRDSFSLQISNNLIIIKMDPEISHWWSPEMNLRFEAEGEETRVYEVVGPNAATFTLAMFFVSLGAVVFIAAFIMWLVQLQLGMASALALTVTSAAGLLVVAALAWLALGRVKAKEQVSLIRVFVQDILHPDK